MGNLCDQDVLCSTSDRQSLNVIFLGGGGGVVSLDSSHHPMGAMADIKNNVLKINTSLNWYQNELYGGYL